MCSAIPFKTTTVLFATTGSGFLFATACLLQQVWTRMQLCNTGKLVASEVLWQTEPLLAGQSPYTVPKRYMDKQE